ncbi:MAG: AIR synthase-related protein, partial [Verrucomicrobiota bacterium]|nr:AIR synthase-related protein [Verrucomicrobiota bacterium]
TCETASRGGTGVEVDLAKVPRREAGMAAYEVLLSESQERMLIIAKRGQEQVVLDIFEKWDVPCAEIGRVTDDGMMRVRNNGSIAAEIPAKPLADEAPLYAREAEARAPTPALDLSTVSEIDNIAALHQLLRDPSIASKNWVYRQYDHMVRTGTVVLPGSDAAVFRVRAADKILAATTDCNSLYCRLDPREGGRIAVAEAARNLTCSGAVPLAVSDNLNFGNPYKPANFWQLRECVEGVAEMCRLFSTPVIGGNVSLYNESPAGVVDPTPTVAMVGLIESEAHITTQYFKAAGDVIILLGDLGQELGASHFLKVCHDRKEGLPPRLDVERELAVQAALRDLIRAGLVRSAHDCSEGGVAVALAECCFNPEQPFGTCVELASGMASARSDELLFGESQSRIVISATPEHAEQIVAKLRAANVPAALIGTVEEHDEFRISVNGKDHGWSVRELYDGWFNAIARAVSS